MSQKTKKWIAVGIGLLLGFSAGVAAAAVRLAAEAFLTQQVGRRTRGAIVACLAAGGSFAMLVAMIAQLGEFRPMTTVQLQTSFVRPVPKDGVSVAVLARVLRFGKQLSYGDVEFRTQDGKLAAHATTTYAML